MILSLTITRRSLWVIASNNSFEYNCFCEAFTEASFSIYNILFSLLNSRFLISTFSNSFSSISDLESTNHRIFIS